MKPRRPRCPKRHRPSRYPEFRGPWPLPLMDEPKRPFHQEHPLITWKLPSAFGTTRQPINPLPRLSTTVILQALNGTCELGLIRCKILRIQSIIKSSSRNEIPKARKKPPDKKTKVEKRALKKKGSSRRSKSETPSQSHLHWLEGTEALPGLHSIPHKDMSMSHPCVLPYHKPRLVHKAAGGLARRETRRLGQSRLLRRHKCLSYPHKR